jgi:glycosyltransferase involved in cell wall biosynthesis
MLRALAAGIAKLHEIAWLLPAPERVRDRGFVTPRFERRPLRRLALVTDAWHPQTNGVANTLSRLVKDLRAHAIEVLVIAPDAHVTVPLPSYPEIRLACDPWEAIPRIRAFAPDAVHLATEGPLGGWVRAWLHSRGLRFTTSFHTRFPEYLRARVPAPLELGYAIERWFHGPAEHTLVGTQSLIRELRVRGVGKRLVHWPRGIDTVRFHPGWRNDDVYAQLPRPIWLYVGRIAREKTLDEFLSLPLRGTKVVVGDGPQRAELERRFPGAVFRGYRFGDDLAAHFASADCFVFPSRTETFGNVLLEAHASGLPIAALPAPGPSDLIEDGVTGALGNDLHAACLRALGCSRQRARANALRYTPRASHDLFRAHLVPLQAEQPAAPHARLRLPSRQTQQRLSDADRAPFLDVVARREPARREHEDRGAVLEPSHLVALAQRRAAGDDVRPAVAEVQQHVHEVQPDAGHQHGRHGHERDRVAGPVQPRAQHRPFVPAKQPLHAAQRDRIHVPGVAGHVRDLVDAAVVRRVEPVIHAGLDAQRHVAAVAKGLRQRVVDEQVAQGVRKTLRLDQLALRHPAHGAHDRVARADHHAGVLVDRPRTGPELTHEAVVQAAKLRARGIAQIRCGEPAIQPERRVAHQRLFDRTDPAHRVRQQPARDAVGQQEVEILLLEETEERGAECHGAAE